MHREGRCIISNEGMDQLTMRGDKADGGYCETAFAFKETSDFKVLGGFTRERTRITEGWVLSKESTEEMRPIIQLL